MFCRDTIPLLILLVSLLFFSCQTVSDELIVTEDGRRCGAVAGAFRGRWWNHFERGRSYADCQMWVAAEADYRAALAQRGDDNGRARTYGMKFVAYFPHRELGISLYQRQRYGAAIEELENSLSHETSAKAQFYLDCARKGWIQTNGLDRADPKIRLSSEIDPGPTKAFNMRIQGLAVDDTFVKRIRLNGRDLPIDLGAAEIPFDVRVALHPGNNRVHLEAIDICGNSTELEKHILCDRSGPLLNVDLIQITEMIPISCRVRGYVSDPSGIRSIRINGDVLSIADGEDLDFQYPCDPAGLRSGMVVTAEDGAGNVTTAVVDRQLLGREAMGRTDNSSLLAANGPLPRHIFTPQQGSPAWMDWQIPEDLPEPPPPYLVTTADPGRSDLETPLERATGQNGRNHALIIGIDAYERWPRLETAVNDARQLARVLTSYYGFAAHDITLLINQKATVAAFIDALMTITAALGEEDNLLIYFAGHGKVHPLADDGYWIPVEGRRGDAIWTWVAHSAVSNLISSGGVSGKHIVVVTDSCYGGRLTRGGQSGVLAQGVLAPTKVLGLAARKSRQIISSGSLEPVPDWGRDGHSLFAYYLLRALEENREAHVCLSSLVNTKVWAPVNRISGQRPVIGRFKTPMDEDGEFVLHLVGAQDTTEALIERASTPAGGLDHTQDAAAIDQTPPTIALKGWETQQTVFLEHAYLAWHFFDQGGIAAIRINGRNILKRPGLKIYFNELARLALGDNIFVIEAIDRAGNRTRQEIHIYRKQPEVEAPMARLSAIMLPFETMGERDLDLQGALFDYLDDSRRFNLKSWQAPLADSTSPAQVHAADDQLTRLLLARGIDCVLSGQIYRHANALEIRTRVVGLEDHAVLAKADVYGEDLDREKIRTMCLGLVNKICRDMPVVEAQVARVRGNKIVINRGRRDGLKSGMPLILFEEEALLDPSTGESLGIDRRPTDAARVESVQENLAHAVLTGDSRGDVAVGQKVITK